MFTPRHAITFLFLVGLGCMPALSQTINTDRPTQSVSAYVLPKCRLQWETGALFERSAPNRNKTVLNNSLVRYGLNDWVELRLTLNYENVRRAVRGESVSEAGFSPVVAGFKSKLGEERGFWPQVAFVGQVALPDRRGAFRSGYYVPGFRTSFQHTLKRSVIGYNWGMDWSRGIGAGVSSAYTLIYSSSLSDELAWFAEFYGFFRQNAGDHRVNAGLTYLLREKIQLDLSGGMGFSGVSPDWFVSGGVSFAFIK